MNYSGEHIEWVTGEKPVTVRCNPDTIMDELQRCINQMKTRISELEGEVLRLKSENYKDEEIQKLQKKLEDIVDERYYGFQITKDEHDRIETWKNDWFKRKRGGNHYMGASGGGFTYRFVPTGLGTSGVVIAPDGEEFQFQEIG